MYPEMTSVVFSSFLPSNNSNNHPLEFKCVIDTVVSVY